MQKSLSFLFAGILLLCSGLNAQRIVYSEPDRDDARTINFEVIGKMNGNFLIYKNYSSTHNISVLDADMKLVEKNKLDFISEKVQDVDIIQYPDFFYLFYQYQKRSVYYAMVAKLDAKGKLIDKPILLDTTTDVNFNNTTKIYTVLNSENKQRIMLFKISTKNDRSNTLTTLLFSKDLQLQQRTRIAVAMPDRNDFLTEFALDNEGDLVCIKGSGTAQNDNINKISMLSKSANADTILKRDISISGIYLDDIRLKVDNINKHYVICSFYSKQRRGNVDGLYYAVYDKVLNKPLNSLTTIFTDEFRSDAKNDGNLKLAFNDFFLKNIVLKKDGGFFVAAEAAYSTTKGNTISRWDYLYGSPYYSGMTMDYYSYYSPMGYYPWGRYNSFNNNTTTRYFADNVVLLSFNAAGKVEWSNVIRKEQYDDNTDNFIGYSVLNTGDKAHFLFNIQEKRSVILTDQSLSPDGQIDRNPTFKNLENGYEFMPRHAKQVGARQMIVPCQFRGATCFAKVEF
ncbi:MAG: hypothetical protein NTZ19_10015 [Bacteroidetes bacterium]|nr:hypothetical protein [Bacteroidota bacterium]